MNIYLEKIASLGEELGHVKEPEKAVSPGSKLIRGAKTLFNHAQIKMAADLAEQAGVSDKPSHTKDILNTGVIGTLGGAAAFASHSIIKKSPELFAKAHSGKVFALGTGLSLAADYAGIKTNNAINKHLDKVASLFPSIGYKKTLNKNEKKEYQQAYGNAPLKHPTQVLGPSLVIGAGVTTGWEAGKKLAKPLSQRIANRIKDRGIISGKYRMADGSHNLNHILHDGVKVHNRVGSALAISGAVLGAIPGISLVNHFRHNYAKGVVEQRRNTHNE